MSISLTEVGTVISRSFLTYCTDGKALGVMPHHTRISDGVAQCFVYVFIVKKHNQEKYTS